MEEKDHRPLILPGGPVPGIHYRFIAGREFDGDNPEAALRAFNFLMKQARPASEFRPVLLMSRGTRGALPDDVLGEIADRADIRTVAEFEHGRFNLYASVPDEEPRRFAASRPYYAGRGCVVRYEEIQAIDEGNVYIKNRVDPITVSDETAADLRVGWKAWMDTREGAR